MADEASARARQRPDTHDPRRARERALKVLFQADLRGEEPLATLTRIVEDPSALAMLDDLDQAVEDAAVEGSNAGGVDGEEVAPGTATEPLDGFTRALVEGVQNNRDEIDALITRFARRWTVPRMPVVDRNVLRLATYELLHEDTPAAIVIDQAVGFAKALSTDNSARYVNGVVDAIRRSIEEPDGGAA